MSGPCGVPRPAKHTHVHLPPAATHLSQAQKPPPSWCRAGSWFADGADRWGLSGRPSPGRFGADGRLVQTLPPADWSGAGETVYQARLNTLQPPFVLRFQLGFHPFSPPPSPLIDRERHSALPVGCGVIRSAQGDAVIWSRACVQCQLTQRAALSERPWHPRHHAAAPSAAREQQRSRTAGPTES